MLFYILQFCIIFLKTIFAYIPGGGGGGGRWSGPQNVRDA